MAMKINQRMVPDGGALYYSAGWHSLIESHLHWLKTRPTNRLLTIENGDAYKYETDLAGLLLLNNIQPQYHWLVMRMNGMTSPTEYKPDQTQLILPDSAIIEQLRAVYQTTNRKIN